MTKYILFQGSLAGNSRRRNDDTQIPEKAFEIADALGSALIRHGLGLILNGTVGLDLAVASSAATTCNTAGIDPRARIRIYPYGTRTENSEFGMIIEPGDKRWQEIRTFVVRESAAVIALVGGKGTSDAVQKAMLAGKPVFPIPVAGGAAKIEWEKLRREKYGNYTSGDIEILGDLGATPSSIAENIALECSKLLSPKKRDFSNRVFVVHGHDGELKNEVARFLSKLGLEPIILQEVCDQGRTLIGKLEEELNDVGYAIVLFTPDDKAVAMMEPSSENSRARQNVILEYGYLLALLGSNRICGIVKGDVEMPSDIHGVVLKQISSGQSLDSISLAVASELKKAGYQITIDNLL